MYIIISSSGPPVLKIGGSLEFYEFSQHSYQDYISRRTIGVFRGHIFVQLEFSQIGANDSSVSWEHFYNRLRELQDERMESWMLKKFMCKYHSHKERHLFLRVNCAPALG